MRMGLFDHWFEMEDEKKSGLEVSIFSHWFENEKEESMEDPSIFAHWLENYETRREDYMKCEREYKGEIK